jgi:hypothetical protein
MNLRPYQNKAIEDIRHHFSRGKMNYLISMLLIMGIFSLVVGMLLVWNFWEK